VIQLTSAPTEGTEVRLTIEPEALKDLFLNQLPQTAVYTFDWPAQSAIVEDTTAPRVELVVVRGGLVEVELSEEVDPAVASSLFTIDAATATWTLDSDAYTLRTTTALGNGTHELRIGTAALDFAGLGLAEDFVVELTVDPLFPALIVHRTTDPRLASSSEVENPFGFQGLQLDEETGLLYVRNRYFDPDLGRFISPDPMGFLDGPSMYMFAVYSPYNAKDPLGLAVYFFDGTFNCKSLPGGWPSNVEKLFNAASRGGLNAFYVSGIGCEANGRSKAQGATGNETWKKLEEMYQHLVAAYKAGDKEINIVGFSRGAALAREFASLIFQRGVETGHTNSAVFYGHGTVEVPEYDKSLTVNFLGLFDTVAALELGAGNGAITEGDSLKIEPGRVRTVRHFVARDEERSLFPLESIRSGPNAALPADWWEIAFPGSHSDVGGGYGPSDQASRIPLYWMWSELRTAGVQLAPLDPRDLNFPADPQQFRHDSRWPNDFLLQALREAFTGKPRSREVHYH